MDGKRLRTGAGPSTARARFLGATSWGVEGTIEVLGLLAASKSGLVGGGTGVGGGRWPYSREKGEWGRGG